MRMTLFVLSAVALVGFYLGLRKWLTRRKFGRVLSAVRDAESRLMFSRLQPAALQAAPSG